MQQTLTQTINILVGDNTTSGSLADTGMPIGVYLALALGILLIATLTFTFVARGKSSKRYGLKRSSFRGFGVLTLLTLSITGLVFNLHVANAAPTLTLSTGDKLTITIPEGGGSASTQTTITTATANATGYTLRAELSEAEPGIAISLKGGSLTESTLLTPGAVHTLSTTDAANASETVDTTAVTLDFQIDRTVTPGTKTLKLVYTAVDNEPTEPEPTPAPTTMQAMTQDYCQNHMTIYNGINEDAILTLQDNRGATPADYQTYQVAKLADNNCWMLNNLKLGSTASAIELTHEDTNIDESRSPFTLPQVVTTGTAEYDNPGIWPCTG